MIGRQFAAAPEQVRETRLMRRPVEVSIGRPSVADEHGVDRRRELWRRLPVTTPWDTH